ncbi:MAG: RNA polymerase II mediator complex subunit, partial [Thelocarpon impressellum]
GPACAALSARLRAFDPAAYDGLMADWLRRTLPAALARGLRAAWLPLIVAGCLGVAAAVAATAGLLAADGTERKARLAFEALLLVARHQDLACDAPDADRFRLQQELYVRDHPLDFLELVRRAVHWVSLDPDPELRGPLRDLMREPEMDERLRALALERMPDVQAKLISPLMDGAEPAVRLLRELVDRLDGSGVGTTDGADADDVETDMQIFAVLAHAHPLSLPFSRLKLQVLMNAQPPGERRLMAQDFYRAVERVSAWDDDAWMELIPGIDDDVADVVCREAEARLLDSFADAGALWASDAAVPNRPELSGEVKRRLLCVVGATARRVPPTSRQATGLVRRIVGLAHLLTARAPAETPSLEASAQVAEWADVLLRLYLIHAESHAADDAGAGGERARVVLALCGWLASDMLRLHPDVLEFTFDVAGLICDGMTPAGLASCAAALRKRLPHDAPLRYLLAASWPGGGSGGDEGAPDEAGDGAPQLQLSRRGAAAVTGRVRAYRKAHWELLPDAAPNARANDTSLSMSFFEARRVR